MLIDSNIIIYAAQPVNATLREFIAQHAPAVSAVSNVELVTRNLAACRRVVTLP